MVLSLLILQGTFCFCINFRKAWGDGDRRAERIPRASPAPGLESSHGAKGV